MKLPDFLVGGAAKSGTTALYEYLRQHPQIFMNEDKETNFFAFEGQDLDFRGPGDEWNDRTVITSLDKYAREFSGASAPGIIAAGESCPWYLYSERAVGNILRHVPGMKMIFMLRSPVQRAYSSYLHVLRDGREKLSFKEGLREEEDRIAKGWEYIWHYRRVGMYSEQVERYMKAFPEEQLRFIVYEDFRDDPRRYLAEIHDFLGVDHFEADLSLRPNATGIPRSKLLGKLLLQKNPVKSTVKVFVPKRVRHDIYHKLNQKLVRKPPLDGETRHFLAEQFEDDIVRLESLIGRDLSAWRRDGVRQAS